MVLMFILSLLGVLGGFVLGIGLIFHMFAEPFYLTIALMALDIFISIAFFVLLIQTGGIAETFAGAKFSGNPIAIILRNDKAIRFVPAKLKEGLAETDHYGRFMILPDSVYNMPNGTTGFLAYYKYGTSIHPNFARSTSRLKEANINDIEQLEELNKKAIEEGKDMKLKLDYVPKKTKEK